MSFSQLLATYYDDLSYTERQAGQYILEHLDQAAQDNIVQLARQSLCSKSTILRLCKKLQFKGYTEMQGYLKFHHLAQAPQAQQADFAPLIQGRITRLIENFQQQDWTPLYQAIQTASKIFIISTGSREQHLALELQRLLIQTNKYAQLITGHVNHSVFQSMIESLSEEDLLFVISHTGEGQALHDMMLVPLLHHYRTIPLTAHYDNWLARHSSLALATGNDFPEGLPFKSNLLPLTVVELMIAGYCHYIQQGHQSSSSRES